jgi:hypothetical protein
MKKSTIKLSILSSIIFILLFSCKKDAVEPDLTVNPTVNPVNNSSNINTFFNQNIANATQSFSINASSFQWIVGAQGTTLNIQPNSFQDYMGNPISGNINIELVEIQTKADMIWLNKTTTSNEQLLISGGEVSVKAFQNGNQLILSPGGAINISLPTNNPVNMQLFAGNQTSNGDVNWGTTNTNVGVDSLGNFNFNLYNGTLGNDSLGWINCDYFYNQANLTTVEVKTPSNFNGTNTVIYFFFNNIYAIAPAQWNNTSLSFKSYTNSLPVGEQITIVAISELNGQLYSSFTPITLTANHSETVGLSATTSTALQTDLNNL